MAKFILKVTSDMINLKEKIERENIVHNVNKRSQAHDGERTSSPDYLN